MKTLRLTLALIVLLVLFIFSTNNAQLVEIAFLSYRSPALPLFLIVTFMFLLGCLLVALLGMIRFSQLRRRNHVLEREVEAMKSKGRLEDKDGASGQPG